MIWWIIGYVFMGTIGQFFLIGIISGITAYKRGYVDCYNDFNEYVADLGNIRMDNQLTRYHLHSDIGVIVWFIFHIATWPVEFARCLFLDIPDAIEHYESLHNKGEA